ncbi:ChaN family lipoprotein [Roseovarius sp. 2305UL8-3]|uniref:ChaN family lipoprotein n=1 Tax=Roseovarius conchicola TaxID=3121636 RepID=UPI00352805C2
MKQHLIAVLLTLSCAANAQDILILGEVHDNPAHHVVQAEKVAALTPTALVFEMLTPDQADGVIFAEASDQEALEAALGWDESGWPDFAMYYPIFAAAAEARIYGAGLPRGEAMEALNGGIAALFGDEAAAYGLDQPLPEDQQQAREALQFNAHCDALPKDMLPGMVDIQRLRDAKLARAALRAYAETGGPVAVITGNGHARRDWGMPVYIAQVAPDIEVQVIGQTEDNGPIEGGFDTVLSSPTVDRPDPCLAFQ